MINLDEIMKNTKPGGTIQLQSDVYVTGGCDGWEQPSGQFLKNGVSIIAPKLGRARIIMQPWTLNRDLTAIWGEGGNRFLGMGNVDVAIDASQPGRKYNGIYLGKKGAESSEITGVHVTGSNGDVKANRESFAICATGESAIVSNCIVSGTYGSYTTAISIAFGGGLIHSNTVYAPRGMGPTDPLWALGTVDITTGITVTNNVVIGPWKAGFYHDTNDLFYAQVTDNSFLGVQIGAWINCQVLREDEPFKTVKEISFANNKVLVEDSLPLNVGISLANGNTIGQDHRRKHCIRGVSIRGNTFGYMSPQLQDRIRTAVAMTSMNEACDEKCGISEVEIRDNICLSTRGPWRKRNQFGFGKMVTESDNVGFEEEWRME